MNIIDFLEWLEQSDATMMDSDMITFTHSGEDNEYMEIYVTDMDEEAPSDLLHISTYSTIIDNGTHKIVIDDNGVEWIFRRLTKEHEGEMLDCSVLEEYLDKKEAIAGILFEDNELPESYEAPSEEHCHQLADLILKRLGLTL